ncbi:NAD(P)/FAD-dependent oxidoreductase [Sporanaerobacter sp. PP17-6a]|uniref:NAD(P)/FAD-dependent oxidoreductase n=1 Tax=Sporanaerobacter sp. PP17-6a TaxID=1891289 RepID=UPI0008A09701|nr:FAD-dependent oxidoreductase [Sporanaerobacter sp. PP17-6a]SCL94607.1 Nitrite reductase [NAD(P)H] [Sporanaerobacter sp. PP17-6a]
MNEKYKYLIIGNGISCLSAIREIRKNDKEGTIAVISKEPYLTYYRIKLTECISKDFKDEELLVNKQEWYDERKVKVVLNKIAKKINVTESSIELDDGMEIFYEKLLLAVGSSPFFPPIIRKCEDGVFALRTIEDLRHIKEYFNHCKSITVIGGGLLGLEAAWSIKNLQKEVNVIEFSPFLLPNQLDEEISRKLERKLFDMGINIYLNSSCEEILGEDEVNGIKLKNNGEIHTDAVLFSTGVRSNLGLVKETDIDFDRGIKVDSHMRTNLKNIYAAGDAAQVDGKVLALWSAGNEQGKVAGANMSGGEREYTSAIPYTTLEIGDVSLFSAGNIKIYDDLYEFRDENNGIHHKLFSCDGKITGVILFGDIKGMNKFRKAVIDKENIKKFLEDNVGFRKI